MSADVKMLDPFKNHLLLNLLIIKDIKITILAIKIATLAVYLTKLHQIESFFFFFQFLVSSQSIFLYI